MVLLAISLRLVSTGAVASVLSKPAVLSSLLFVQTGRWVPLNRQTSTPPASTPQATALPEKTPVPTTPQPAQPLQVQFQATDGDLVAVHNATGYETDVQAMLSMPLSWDLTKDGPSVLILHSHGSESYTKTESYDESSAYRTLDTGYNVVSVGARLKEKLEQAGIGVIHDTTVHDYPSYNDSYVQAREAIEDYLKAYPSIRMVLDIHRDAVELEDGTQKGYTTQVDGQKVAQLMMVVGTDAGGRHHPQWKQNFALAVKLHVQLEKENPGICRPISFRTQRFNQDLSNGGMLIEVGAAGNTRQEALLAADRLAEGIVALAHGTQEMVY